VKGYGKDLNDEIEDHERKLAELNTEKANLEEKIEYLDKALKELEVKTEAEKERIEDEINELLARYDRLNLEVNNLCDEWRKSKEGFKPQLEKLEELQRLRGDLEKRHRAEHERLTKLRMQIEAKVNEVNKTYRELKGSKGKEGETCDECGREFTAEDIGKLVGQLKINLKRQQAEYNELEGQKVAVQEKEEHLKSLFGPLDEKIEGIEKNKAALEKREHSIVAQERLHCSRIKEIERDVEAKRKMIDEIDTGDPGYREEIEKAREEAMEVDARGMALADNIYTLKEKAELVEILEEVLGNGGLKSYIFDSVTPELNKLISEYIQMLDDIDIEISTVTKLKSKDDYREKFCINVNNRHGSSLYSGNSGGEQQKINLAIAMGSNRLVRKMAEESINVIFLDEPFESLDEGSSEKVIELCETFADTSNVFLITHNPGVKELISNVITVEKKGGSATIK
jgi:DNA repair exonuclease SbcCD ATPase subunit